MTSIENSGFEPGPVERSLALNGAALVIRLEQAVWDAFDEIAVREALTGDELCAKIDKDEAEGTLTEKICRFACDYFRDAVPPVRRGMSEDDGSRSALQQALDAVGPKS